MQQELQIDVNVFFRRNIGKCNPCKYSINIFINLKINFYVLLHKFYNLKKIVFIDYNYLKCFSKFGKLCPSQKIISIKKVFSKNCSYDWNTSVNQKLLQSY